MKKNRQIYMLIVIYSLITITTFARGGTLCIANDHVGLKVATSICCDDNKENGTSINNSTDKCFECNDFPLTFPNNSDQHISSDSQTIDYSSQKERVPFNIDSFVDLKVIPNKQLESPSIDKIAPTRAKLFLQTLRTVSLLI